MTVTLADVDNRNALIAGSLIGYNHTFDYTAQADAAAVAVDAFDFDFNHVADGQAGAARDLAAVQQAVLLDPDVNERAEVDNVAHRAIQ